MSKSRTKIRWYSAIMMIAIIGGLTPTIANWVIDPFRMNGVFDFDLDREEISLKAHYPLWKMIEYPSRQDPFVILGDSRARALQDRYWNEVGITDAYNFAYGGATIFEISDTFDYLKHATNLETLIVSLPLRSFDERHKNGLNRVPEAINMAANPFSYYTSWFVLRTALKNIDARYGEDIARLTPSIVSKAHAADYAGGDSVSPVKLGAEPVTLDVLLDPRNCRDCDVPEKLSTTQVISFRNKGPNLGLGRGGLGYWSAVWSTTELERDLPRNFAKQVGTNGAADWRRFEFSERLWQKIEAIHHWTEDNNVQLVFVIPPTITEMQKRVRDFGFARLNNEFRLKLAALAPVVDFDFDSPFTRDLEQFTDAYHFNAKAARAIVGEIAQLVSTDPSVSSLARTRRQGIRCPVTTDDTQRQFEADGVTMRQGISCRIWETQSDQ